MRAVASRPMTLTGKILYHHAIAPQRPWVAAGDLVRVRVDWTIASELAWNGMNQTYDALGRPPLHDPGRFYLALDHTVDPRTLESDARTQRLVGLARGFAKEAGIRHFYDANVTIMHTTFYRDLVRPGDVVLGADSHTSSHGGLGAFAIGLGGADVTVAMVLGETWIEVPEAIAVEYRGEIPFGLTGKDVILKTLGDLGRNTVALERSVEFVGDAARRFSADMRFTIANMTAEFGGLNGIFEPDALVAEAVARRAEKPRYADYVGGLYLRADEDAPYVARYPISLDALEPQVAKPFSPDNVFGVSEAVGQQLDGVFIGACTTTEEELVVGALVLEQALAAGADVRPSENRLVVPGNLEITDAMREAGLLSIYERAGFRVGPPGCSMCLGIASDRADEGEVWLSSQNRNFQNRMGKGSIAWLGSAATVAASALDLRVADPRPLLDRVDRARLARLLGRDGEAPAEIAADEVAMTAEARDGAADAAATVAASDEAAAADAPTSAAGANQGAVEASGGNGAGAVSADGDAGDVLRGRVQRFGDHVDTDAMIPGEFCHLTELSDIGAKAFFHVRPEFPERVAAGRTIVVAGEAWGSGSSREHAVWALKGAGVDAVVARSFAFIHKRNLVNEAVPHLIIRDDRFYELCDEDVPVEIDLAAGVVSVAGERFTADAPSPMVQALTAEGGIVAAIRRYGDATFDQLQRS